MDLTVEEIRELQRLRGYFPFRKWFVVKPLEGKAHFVDGLRKAKSLAKELQTDQVFAITR